MLRALATRPHHQYRYYNGSALFPFGRGLSLTSFSFSCTQPVVTPSAINVSCTVTNTGALAGDEVLLVFHSVGDAIRAKASKLHPVPLKQLVGFERVGSLAPAASTSVTFSLEKQAALSLTTADGSRAVYSGEHRLTFSTGVPGVADLAFAVAAAAA